MQDWDLGGERGRNEKSPNLKKYGRECPGETIVEQPLVTRGLFVEDGVPKGATVPKGPTTEGTIRNDPILIWESKWNVTIKYQHFFLQA